MNRRNFLTRLSTGLVGACVAAHIPTGILPAKVRTTAALAYLREEFNRVCKGVGAKHLPTRIYAGRELFEAVKAELVPMVRLQYGGAVRNARYPESLMFKAATLLPSDWLDPWGLMFAYENDPNQMVITVDIETLYVRDSA